jgi:ferritin-like metal-binding protein YciE
MDRSDETRDLFLSGLRNAHAMETQALSVMQPQLNRLENYPELKALLEQHYRETEEQIARLDQIFESLGESASGMKDTMLSAMGSMQSMSHALASDEILKNTMADYMFEHFEIASYTSLITMAEVEGLTNAVSLLERTLEEERRCAASIYEMIPVVTQRFMQRTAQGQRADV